jgi:hypothetical protein
MTKCTVFRVEDQDGIGPYSKWGVNLDVSNTDNHPTPSDDGIHLDYDHNCAFNSIEQLRNWFSDRNDQGILVVKGFTCNVYSVPIDHVKIGYKQVTFNKRYAEKISSVLLEEAFSYSS